MFPVTWTKGTFSNVNGKLILTNRRLIFTAGRFQSIVGAVVGAHKDRVEIPLNTITSVDKGFMAVITPCEVQRGLERGQLRRTAAEGEGKQGGRAERVSRGH